MNELLVGEVGHTRGYLPAIAEKCMFIDTLIRPVGTNQESEYIITNKIYSKEHCNINSSITFWQDFNACIFNAYIKLGMERTEAHPFCSSE